MDAELREASWNMNLHLARCPQLPAWEKVGIFYSCYQEVFFLSRYAPEFGFSNGWTRWGFEKKHSNSNILIWLFEVVYTSSTTVYAWGSEASVLLFSKKSPWYSSPFLSLSSQLSFSFSISFSLPFLLRVAAWVLESGFSNLSKIITPLGLHLFTFFPSICCAFLIGAEYCFSNHATGETGDLHCSLMALPQLE